MVNYVQKRFSLGSFSRGAHLVTRSILNEVLEEGGEPQQKEARQLLEELGD